jgi:hypothetical protein
VVTSIPFAVIVDISRDPSGFTIVALERESVCKLSPPNASITRLDVVIFQLSIVFVLMEGVVIGMSHIRRVGVYCIDRAFCPKRRLLVTVY